MEEFDKYTKALKEYQEYSRSYNEQVQKLRGLIVCHEKICTVDGLKYGAKIQRGLIAHIKRHWLFKLWQVIDYVTDDISKQDINMLRINL